MGIFWLDSDNDISMNRRLHDFDNNTMLDGLEILKALTHLLPYEDQEDTEKVDPRGKTMEQVNEERRKAEIAYYTGLFRVRCSWWLDIMMNCWCLFPTEIVDQVLEEDDIDNDGYLSYAEYMMARRRDDLENDSREHWSHLIFSISFSQSCVTSYSAILHQTIL